MKKNIIKLPVGHKWLVNKHSPASEAWFECECGAEYIHEMIDGSHIFNEGDGSCNDDDDDEPHCICGSGLFDEKGECQKCGL